MEGRAGTRRDWVVLLCWAALLLLFLAVSVQKIWAGDFWGHLRAGEEILRSGLVPRVDDWSYTAAGNPVVEVRWLYCVLVALGWKAGPWLLCVGMAAVLGAMWGMILGAARRVMTSPMAMLLFAVGLVAGSGRWVLRPELATYLFVAAFLVGLEGARRRGRIGWAWWLIAGQVLWANTHSLFVFGPVLAWMFAGAGLVERVVGWRGSREWGWVARMALLAVGVTAACWANPYFHRGATFAIGLWGEMQGATGELVGELKSPLSIPIGLWRWDLWASAGLAAMVAGIYVMNWRRVGLARLGVLVIALYLGATAQRNASLLAIMGVWAGFVSLLEWRGAREAPARAGGAVALPGRVGVALASLAAAWYQASDRVWTDIGVGRETGVGVVDWDVAKGAADFVVSSGADPRVFNYMRDGYYLGWRSDGAITVFINGRTDVFGPELVREYMRVGAATWDVEAEKWGINTAVLQVRGFEDLIRHLVKSPGWSLVYLDHRNVVFVRQGPERAGLIGKYRIDPGRGWTAEREPREEVESWKAGLGAHPRPWYTFGMAQSFLAIGSVGNAEVYLRRTLERWPRHERAIAELAAVCRFTGRVTEGDALARTLKPGSEWAQYTERSLAGMLMDAGRRAEGAAAIERAIQAGARESALFVSAGDWLFESKDYAGARTRYEMAMKSGVDTAAEWKKLGYAREKTGDAGGAQDAYRRSLVKDPGQHEVWYLLGLVRAKAGDRAGAREALERAVKAKSDYAPARRALQELK